ncbi:MAG: DNA primase [Ruminococcaceae bacterium]|nr:DNA primase [Oscillospiraceae bacterium]
MAIPEEVINEIKYRNDIETVMAPYVDLKRRGKNLVGLCPFHNEKTPSFTVYPENGSFYCFGCGVGGDVFTFTGLIENLDYIDSVRLLAEKSGIVLDENKYDNSMQKLKNTIYDINRETARFFHSYLMSEGGKWALDYLVGRGLSVSTIKHFGLGAAPDSWDALINHLKSKGFSIADMYQANVIGKSSSGKYYDRFRRRVMFPIINVRGNVVAFSGRAMPGDDKAGGKYVNTADTPVYKKSDNLFGMNFAKKDCAERIILVEGNMDVVSLHQAGFSNTVAALGTAFTPEQAKLLTKYTKEIVLMLDADAAGQKAMKRAGEILKNTGLKVRVVLVPDGKDPDEYIKKNGAARFSALLDGAVSEIEYKLLTAAADINTESDDGRLKYLSAAAEILADTPDVITRDIYIGRLSDKYGVSRTALESKIKDIRKGKIKEKEKKEFREIVNPTYKRDEVNPEKRQFPKAAAAEESIIAILLKHQDLIGFTADNLPSDKMITSLNKRIYSLILEAFFDGRDFDFSYISQFLSAAETGYLVSLQNSSTGDKNAKAELGDCIKILNSENDAKSLNGAKNMPTEEWADNLANIIKNKTKGNF